MTGFWLRDALADEPAESEALDGEVGVDVCIVGGGYTGLWTALHLKQLDPSADVAIVERDVCGGGASGRNGGFVMTWSSKVLSLVKLCGAQEAVRLIRASEEAVSAIGSFCERHGIDAGFRRDGWLWTASSEVQLGAWSPSLEALDRLGLSPFEALEGGEVAERSGSALNIAGVFEAGVATVHPARLARGMRRVALEKGVRIFERTPMNEFSRHGKPWVRTPGGTVHAGSLVLALNAWAAELPEFRRTVLPIGSDIVATEAAPEAVAGTGLRDGVAVSDSRLLVHYYRTTPDGRIALGKGGGSFAFAGRVGNRFDAPTPRGGKIEASLRRFFPGLDKVGVADAWQGPVTRTATGLPFFGRLPGASNVVYGHGYCGNGVGPSYLGGRILASLALGRDDEWATTPLARGARGRFPPEPARFLGARLVRGAIERMESAQDRGLAPGALDTALAAFAPAGLVPTSDKDD